MTKTVRSARQGHVMLVAALAMTAIMGACCLAVDVTAALRVKAAQRQRIELAKDACMASLNALKFAEDPASATESVIEAALAADGASGKVTVAYRELPESQTGSSRRVAGVYVRMEGSYRTIFGGLFGLRDLEVASEGAWSTMPYSSSEVWRPAAVRSTAWELSMESGSVASRSEGPLGSTPQVLSDALAAALAKSPV